MFSASFGYISIFIYFDILENDEILGKGLGDYRGYYY